MKYLALLRGINVGGKNLLPMKDLALMFTSAGATDVKTYIQSGNVVFSASPQLVKKLPALIPDQIVQKFGMRIPLVIRSAEEVAEVIASNPYLQDGEPEDALHVYFLADVPTPENLSKLDPNRSHPDRFILRNRDLYVHLPAGMARTKLTNAYFDSKLATVSTARNWRTVLKLHEMLRA